MTWPEVQRAVADGATTVILPFGATEQHGPHLPLATDTIRADALAELLAERIPGSLIAPTLPFGCSDEHWGFSGLIGLDHETLARVVLDLARRMHGWGITRLVLLSAHGGNREGLELARKLLEEELLELNVFMNENFETISTSLLDIATDDGLSGEELGLHAGESETSELLHLSPELVGGARESGFVGDMESVMDDLRAGGLAAVTENGVLGDPSRACARRGARYLEAVADELAVEIEARR